MSRSTHIPLKSLKSELIAGIYPLTIRDVKTVPIDDYDYNSIISFECGGKTHQELFKVGSSRLYKLLIQCDIDPSLAVIKREIIGKRVWGYIRAVCKIKDYKVSGDPTFELFDTTPYVDGMKPVHSDSPELNEGRFVGEFIRYQDEVIA